MQIVTVGKSVPLSSREEALTKFARAVFNRLFEMARGKEDNPAAVPLLRVEVRITWAEGRGGRERERKSPWPW